MTPQSIEKEIGNLSLEKQKAWLVRNLIYFSNECALMKDVRENNSAYIQENFGLRKEIDALNEKVACLSESNAITVKDRDYKVSVIEERNRMIDDLEARLRVHEGKNEYFYLSKKDFEKFEYLVGFANTVAEIVCDPEEMLDPNTGDTTVFSVGYSVDNSNVIELSTLESDTVKDFRENFADLETEIKNNANVDFSKKWKELQGQRMDFIEKSQREIEPQLSAMGYRYNGEVKLGGERFICTYVNQEQKKKLQLVYELYSHNAFCKEIYIEDLED